MSLFGALTTAVSGLSVQEQAISYISDNIANSQTTGYKGVEANFETLVTYGNVNTLPGGVAAEADFQNSVSGNLVQSQQSTSLAVNGQGFFVVKKPTGATDSAGAPAFDAANYYTRRGDFETDKNGYLVNGSGYTLEAFPIDATTGAVTTIAQPVKVPVNQTTPAATSLAGLIANLPSNYPVQGASGYTSPAPVTMQVYDADGGAHTVSVQFDKTAANTWKATLNAPDSVSPQQNPVTLQLKFSDGTSASTLSGASTPPQAGTLIGITDISATSNGTPPTITTAASGADAKVTLGFNFGTGAQSVALDLGGYGASTGLTQFAGSSVDVTSQTQNGYGTGTQQSVAIDKDGVISVNYSNGQNVKLAQVSLALFAAPDQLATESGDAFSQTTTSGTPTVTQPGTGGAGQVSPSTLEQSNVSLTSELTRLVAAQQAYTSNARVITTTNQMVQTLNSLIQG